MNVYAMEYQARMRVAWAGSFTFHLLVLLFALIGYYPHGVALGLGGSKAPLVINLQPPTPKTIEHFVESVAPAEEPVQKTDLVSTEDSNASDLADVEGTRETPYFEVPSDFDELAPPATSPAPPSAPSPPPERPASKPVSAPEMPPVEKPVMAVASNPGPAEPAPETQGDEAAEPGQPGTPAPPEGMPGKSRGRIDGGVKSRGFVGFEAMRHELAPYLKTVRDRVERRWATALELRYNGSWATEAVLDCSIAPDGHLVYVEIVNAGNSPTYAPLCKEALEKAAPFPAFPFNVPEVYRSKNLEIRWTFSFR